MRAVLQRVTRGQVKVAGEVVGAIDQGLVVLVGAGAGDTEADLVYVVDKLVNLRIFADDDDKMNRSVLDVGGGVLWISQFTLYGDARAGRRPGFSSALAPDAARGLYDLGTQRLRTAGVSTVGTGVFGADMEVTIVGDGPVTILLDSRKQF